MRTVRVKAPPVRSPTKPYNYKAIILTGPDKTLTAFAEARGPLQGRVEPATLFAQHAELRDHVGLELGSSANSP